MKNLSQTYEDMNFQSFIAAHQMMDELLKPCRERIAGHLRIQPGDRILDVGCGIGTAVLDWVPRVGPHGRICGIDLDEAKIAEAKRRAARRSAVEFRSGDACALPYANASFDAVCMERVLQIIPDREQALAEMLRVARPGGRVVVSDIDLESTAIYSRNRLLTRKITALISDSVSHPTTARELPALCRAAGLSGVNVETLTVQTPFELFVHRAQTALRSAIEVGNLTPQEMDAWYEDLIELEAQGMFFNLWFFVIVSGAVRT